MTTTERRFCPPAPPPGIGGSLPTKTLTASWVRIHWGTRPALAFSTAKRDGNRFDPLPAPWQASTVLYAGSTLEVAIAETILRWRDQVAGPDPIILSTATQIQPRSVSSFVSKRPLKVIDATGLGLRSIQTVVDEVVKLPLNQPTWASRPAPMADDIFQCSADQYRATQDWGSWFRSQCPDADGIRWVSRQFNTGQCVVLFGNHCDGQLEQSAPSEPLLEPGSKQQELLDRMLVEIGWSRD